MLNPFRFPTVITMPRDPAKRQATSMLLLVEVAPPIPPPPPTDCAKMPWATSPEVDRSASLVTLTAPASAQDEATLVIANSQWLDALRGQNLWAAC